MQSYSAVGRTVKVGVVLILAFSLSGCSWLNWFIRPWKQPPASDMAAVMQKLDGIAASTTLISRDMAGLDQRFTALEQRVEAMEARMNQAAQLSRAASAPPEPVEEAQAAPPPKPQGPWMSAASEEIQAPAPMPVLRDAPPAPKAPEMAAPAAPPAPAPAPRTAAKPQDPSREYAQAYAAYEAGRLDQAMSLFQTFVEQHPDHDLADNAQYWIGEVHYDNNRYPQAIAAFQKVVDEHPDTDKAPAALLKIGYSHLESKQPEKAAQYLRKVVTDYPFSELVGKARDKLKNLQTFAGASDAYTASAQP